MNGLTNPNEGNLDTEKGPLIGNPESQTFNITVSVPDKINIRMVDASTLADYEIWIFLSSLLSSSFVGFFIPFIQARNDSNQMQTPLFWMALVFLILFLIALGMALHKRRDLRKKGRDLELRTSPIADENKQEIS